MSDAAEGLDPARLQAWLAAEQPGLLTGPVTASLITGGKSNLTYAVTDGQHDLVVRRPPLGHVLATAHDMGREFRVMTALAGTAVPVPRTYAHTDDPEVIGAPFYVMERVRGTAFARASQLERLGANRTRLITERMVDTLVALHAVDVESVGLGDFGRPDGYLERQVRRWKKQLDASRSRDLPGIDDLVARLEREIPCGGDATIVHGDFRLDNLLVDASPGADDQVTAVLDWEMSTLGDPLTDVAILLAYQRLAEDVPSAGDAIVTDAALAPGHLSRDEVLARYAAGSGRAVDDIDFHLALAYFKLAVILEGIHYRFSQGQTVGEGFEGIGDLIGPLIAAGLSA